MLYLSYTQPQQLRTKRYFVTEIRKSWTKHKKWIGEQFFCTLYMDRLATLSCQCFLLSLEDVFRAALESVWLSAPRKKTKTWEAWQRISLGLDEFKVKHSSHLADLHRSDFHHTMCQLQLHFGTFLVREKRAEMSKVFMLLMAWSMGTVLNLGIREKSFSQTLGLFSSFVVLVGWFLL